ncbi:site-specific DNA-methyltransferase [Streptomyces sp. NBC_00101]|uniref:site-specific DNA-methyltransferase n=1 Tax=Streptomyces sp. NBC_00101 TaxID=2975651 RepID=UPI0032500FBA
MATAKKQNGTTGGTPTGSVSVEGAQAIKHEDKRINIPTADAADLLTESAEAIEEVVYARVPWLPAERRDRALDPQLVWTGKDEADRTDLVVAAPPIFRQERIEAQYLVNELIKETNKRKPAVDEPDGLFSLGDYFQDGIPDELDKVDWYNHQMNWANRMILGDSLQVMASLAEREDLREKVQMVFLDPPYGIKFNSNWQVSTKSRDVKDGSLAHATREVEQVKAFRDTWELGISSYLTYLRDRLIVARDLLTESGSVFVQIGDENVHLVRSLLDEVFGKDNFFAQITFAKTSSSTGTFGGTCDYVVWYAKNVPQMKYRQLYLQKATGGVGGSGYTRVRLADGTVRPLTKDEIGNNSLIPDGARIFAGDNITSQSMGRDKGEGAASWFTVKLAGRSFDPGPKARWKTNEAGMAKLILAERVVPTSGNKLSYVRYLDDFPAVELGGVWTDTLGQNQFGGDKVYVVQTALPVVTRCMLMATDPGDLVLDPTCGSGTTAHVAEQWGRRWITIDTSRVAIALARHRIMGARYPAYLLSDSPEGKAKEAELNGRAQDRSKSNNDVHKGFVCNRIPHIMLRSIATNPEIKPGMSRVEIDAAIQKHAEYETLFDRPYENKRALRVAGPFTVESLSPHRSISFDGELPKSEQSAKQSAGGGSYAETILEHIKTAGVQNGIRDERLVFESIEPASGRTLTAVGMREQADAGTPARVGIALGPEYGTVDPLFIKNAAREAIAAGNLDLLLVLGFAFDPTAVEAVAEFKPAAQNFASVVRERTVGKLPVLLVRMNADLSMGDELAKSSTANLFTVFGEPDIEVTEASDGQLVVEVKGVDTYNPTTGKISSLTTDSIMLWSLDTDYDSDAFFVRHVYFNGKSEGKPGDLNPYERLQKTLKADIDQDAWASLYATRSRPFAKPASGKIAVKVIDYYGDEVLKVIEV